jgi:two-component system cell cycle sensor histidine kinase/response regulator CckA
VPFVHTRLERGALSVRRLRDLSIRHRLTLVMVLTSSFALVMAGAGLLVFEGLHFYRDTRDDVVSLAEVVAANGSAALAFGDRTAAQETLEALRSRTGIVCAGLYDTEARPFAGYCRAGGGPLPAGPGVDRLVLEGASLVLARPVTLDRDRVGTVLMRASLEPVLDHVRGYALTVLLTALVAIGAAALVSARLQCTVSRPILHLAATARAVTRDGDYSRRVPRLGNDELGDLIDDFNEMLARIEAQDAALRAARDELGLWLAAQQEDLRFESVERRRAEDLARRLVQAVQSSHEMISITDADGRFVFVNQAFLAAYGYREEEVLGQPVTLVDSPDNPNGLRLQIERGTLQGGWHGELLNRRKDGSEFPISLGTSVIRDELGAVVGLLGVARDISERKQSEERLRLQEAALAATVDAVVITDRDGRIEWVNPAFTRLTGYEPAEALGRNPRFLKSGAQPREFYEALWATLLEGRVWYGELSNRRKDGSLYTEEMTITPIFDEERDIAHFAAIKRDISERLALESQLHGARKMESLGQLAGGVAHDFNNLLGVVRGHGELLAGRLDPGDPREAHVGHILDAANRAAKLTRQLLAFGRRQVLEPRVVDLNRVVAGMEPLLSRLVGEAVKVVVRTAPDLGRVRVDSSQVDQVLLNLAANARDAMPRGGRLTVETANAELGEADCRARAGARPGSFVRLRVSDTGTGMDEATRARAFEPFFTTKDVGQGTGLGLATVYGIVKQSGGHVWVDSSPGKGACFEIYLPTVEGEVEAEESQDELPAGPPAVHTPATILLVEDEASLREIAKELLEANGYAVIAAADAREALALAESTAAGPIHLLLTDVMMPGLSGPALARHIRERWPEVEVLYMSGYSHEAVEKQGALGPGSRLLAKPFSLNTLVRSVEEALA